MRRIAIFLAACMSAFAVNAAAADYSAQPSEEILNTRIFKSDWISPDELGSKVGLFHFRKSFNLEKKPESFVINVSADRRYKLYVNGEYVCFGPSAGSPDKWYFDTLDIAPMLKEGKNVIAVAVWNFGTASPTPHMSCFTGLAVFGNSDFENALVKTDETWKILHNEGWGTGPRPLTVLAGHMETIDGVKNAWGWERPDFDDSAWPNAKSLSARVGFNFKPVSPAAEYYGQYAWALSPRNIPMMEETPQKFGSVRRTSGVENAQNILKGQPLEIPAKTKCSILIDQGFLTTAFLETVLSGGKGAKVKLTYAENLIDSKGQKGNRNEIDGKNFYKNSPCDVFTQDGGANRLFRPLWFRTYRYLQVDVETADAPLVIEKLSAFYTGYPFRENGSFASSDEGHKKIWEVGWRTARLCAHETYFDCPFYEQLQYVGDTRIQALISLYVSGDDRLMKKAILSYDVSRGASGLTHSRFPSWRTQYIPPFSLYWINMLADFQRHREDPEFVSARLEGVRAVIGWFTNMIDPETGFLKADMPFWNFADWVTSWRQGNPPENGSGSALHSLHFANALDDAARIMESFGHFDEAGKYSKLSESIKKSVYEKCWDEKRGLLRDCIGGEFFSQHTNTFGILTNAIPVEKQREVFEKITSNPIPNDGKTHLNSPNSSPANGGVVEATFYYKFYVIRAMKKVGLADGYVEMLNPWKDMIAKGLTTFAETPDPCRSECHAWSASPNYDFLATVCGIEPDSAAFKSVKVEPHLGSLKFAKGKVPHPLGMIEVDFKKAEDGSLSGTVILPQGLEGRFVHAGKEIKLASGKNEIGAK